MKVPTKVVIAIVPLLALALYLIFGRNGERAAEHGDSIYRVRVTVLNPQGVPVEEAKVWSSMGGEGKKVAGGWQFDIPAASRPQHGQLTIFAAQESAFLTGRTELILNRDFNPTVTLKLTRDDSARVAGLVVDSRDRPVVGARVFIDGREAEAVMTREDGRFDLPAHAADNQQVLLQAEKPGVGTVTLWHPAGDRHAELKLQR